MRRKTAEELFHGKEHYNCVQAVLGAFSDVFDIDTARIDDFAHKGGGRAEKGMCGALYGAHLLLKEKNKTDIVDNAFKKEAGSLYCKEIRKINKLKCKDCVSLAVAEVEKILEK